MKIEQVANLGEKEIQEDLLSYRVWTGEIRSQIAAVKKKRELSLGTDYALSEIQRKTR